eukprot:jgi/Tetstr1/457039/TSEL_043702.t1
MRATAAPRSLGPLPLAAVAIALALLGGSHLAHGQFSDGNCGSHGRSDPDNGGACVCDTPHPEPGQQGWTGTFCDIGESPHSL